MINSNWLPWTMLHRLAVIPVIAFGVLSMLASAEKREELSHPTIKLSASSISPNDVALSWKSGTEGIPEDEYEVFMNGAFLLKTTETSAVASALTPDTEYCFQVQIDTVSLAFHSRPLREYSNVACATTLPTP